MGKEKEKKDFQIELLGRDRSGRYVTVGWEGCMVDGLMLSIARNLNSIEQKLETINKYSEKQNWY